MTKAMILAAGRGERMRPLTDTLPKSLVKVGPYSLIEWHLFALQKIGVQEIVINLHHLGEEIIKTLGDGSRYGVKIDYSQEKELLGTGGGIKKVLPLLGKEPFLLLSGDIFTNYPLENLLTKAEAANFPLAHLIMAPNPSYHPTGDYGLDEQGYLTFSDPRFTYASFGVINPELFPNAIDTIFPLGDLFSSAIRNQQITGELFEGVWENIGTQEQLISCQEKYSLAKLSS